MMDFLNLIPAVRRAREERDRAQLYAEECREALRRSNERLAEMAGVKRELEALNAVNECLPRQNDCHVMVFGSNNGQRGIVAWAGREGHGTTTDLSAAGVFSRKDAAKLVGNSRSKVLVPVWYVQHLQVRRVVHTNDALNASTWHPLALEKAIRSAARGRSE